ncbi:MAG: hypothetical protein KDC27_14440, partial [Acidobacteria bacterium]|nr:hypothetical protein [Acidobacteriota bacterium]
MTRRLWRRTPGLQRRPPGRRLLLFLLSAFALAAQAQSPGSLGFYQWVGVAPAGETDILTAARERTTALGLGLLRFYVGPRFDYVHPYLSPERFAGDEAGARTPADILQIPRYAAALDDPALQTVILTVYASLDYGAGPDDLNLLRPWGDEEQAAETAQIEALCELLYNRWGDSGKTVILANHEADEKLMESLNYDDDPQQAIATLVAWTNARHQPTAPIRGPPPDATPSLLQAFENATGHLHIRQRQIHNRKS